jgi:transcriptional regulator GlxA family with amidase domain
MAKKDTVATVALFGFEDCSCWITAGLFEMFAIANNAIRITPQRKPSRNLATRFECHIVSRNGRTVRGSHGVLFPAHRPRRHYDVLIVPPIWCESREDLERRAIKLRSMGPFLIQLAKRSTIVASSCSGAVLLADAGLLTGHRATTCWWLVDWFRQMYPQIELVPDRLVMRDRNIWTGAAGSAYIHLGLDLVRELAGEAAAATTARLMLVERRRGSQSPFMPAEPIVREGTDAEVRRAMQYLDQHAGRKLPIAEACRALAIGERTLARRFRASIGMSPLGYLQSRRIARAKQLLESTALPLERILERCGYEDLSSFRKLFARQVGMTPREYRSRFGADS